MNSVIPNILRKRIRRLKRRFKSHQFRFIAASLLLIIGIFIYAGYMATKRLSVDAASCQPLLNLIATFESGGNYNAYYGHSRNSTINFTNMSIADVMKWQNEYVANGSPSSAVGRYQIINTTLSGLVQRLGIQPHQKFDKGMQDRMAVALLEKRGANEYVNQELSKKEFAANLAKEWAALPKVIGPDPNASYYAGDGLNRSHIEPEKVFKAIDPIKAI
jgi:hypothetical protein